MRYDKVKTARINSILFYMLIVLAVIFLVPIGLVLINSFKSRLFISSQPFAMPKGEMFVGFTNYLTGLTSSGFFLAFLRSAFITLFSVGLILICTSMTSWFIARVRNRFTKGLYYLFAFSMIVPFLLTPTLSATLAGTRW